MPDPDYQDDRTIPDSERLLRRIFPGWYVPDPKVVLGRRVTSQAFQNASNGTGMSVHLASVLASLGLADQSVLRGYDGYGLAQITAGLARQWGQRLARRPEPDWPAHAEVLGNKAKPVQRAFAAAAKVLIEPIQPSGT